MKAQVQILTFPHWIELLVSKDLSGTLNLDLECPLFEASWLTARGSPASRAGFAALLGCYAARRPGAGQSRWCVQLCWWCISINGKIHAEKKIKLNNSFTIFNYVDLMIWCGSWVCLSVFAAKLPNLKRDYLGHFCIKWHCSCVHMKAENLRIPKLSLLLHLVDSKPGLWAIKHDRAFFLRHPVLNNRTILLHLIYVP